jgi:putative transposase
LSFVFLVDEKSNTLLERVFPQNKTQNASGQRRLKEDVQQIDEQAPQQEGIAPLLKELMEEYAQTGFPPAYIPKGE